MRSITISLAGTSYKVNDFTIGQLEALHVGVLEAVPVDVASGAKRFWDRNIEILAAALSVDHPDLTADKIRGLRLGTVQAVNDAVSQVLEFAGLAKTETRAEGDPQGEAQRAA